MSRFALTNRVIVNARKKGCVVYRHVQWGSISGGLTYRVRVRTRPHRLLPTKPVDTVWQHISVTYDTGKSGTSFKKDMRTLERIGNERFKTGVSYNFCWDAVTGEIGLGQYLEASGAHTQNTKGVARFSEDQNPVSIAIAVIGMPGVKPTQRAVQRLIWLLRALKEEGAVTLTFEYVPHSLVAAKDCPTQNIRDIMPGIRREVDMEIDRFPVAPATDLPVPNDPNIQHAINDLVQVRRRTFRKSRKKRLSEVIWKLRNM